jgi:hypothetical protein
MSGFRALVLGLLAGPAGAQPLDAPGFEAFVQGKAFAYARGGVVFGSEVYQSSQRVFWLGADGVCLTGQWRAEAGEICFYYDQDGTGLPRVCAQIEPQGSGLHAVEWDGGEVTGVLVAMPDLSACQGASLGS